MYWADLERNNRAWDPWREMERMRRFIADYTAPRSAEFPAMNIWSNGNEALVTTELPGIDVKDVEISVQGKFLTLRGSRSAESAQGESFHRRERWFGPFSRTMELPFGVDPGKVDARFSRGILAVTLPRAEADKPKKIDVRTE